MLCSLKLIGGFEQIVAIETPIMRSGLDKTIQRAGIQTHMLDRSLNGIRMNPVPADVRKLFIK